MNKLTTVRVTIIVIALGFSLGFIVFFLVAPLRGYPLRVNEAQELLNLVLPTFSGYLATCAAFVFRKPDATDVEISPLTMFLLLATAVVFISLIVILFWVFYYASKLHAPQIPMDYATLKGFFLTILSIMTAVYALAIAYLFHTGKSA